jgi:hypothetical protein
VPSFEVYATTWSDPRPIEQIPATGLEFSMPLSDHGECSFSATVEPGRSFWRPALSAAMSGVLVCSDGVPVWSGQMMSEAQSGPRTFDFTFAEWGSFFEQIPSKPLTLANVNDHVLFRRLITDAQAVAGQSCGIILGTTLGAAVSDLTINAWDSTTVEEEFRRLADAKNGPEWYVDANRNLVLGDRLGSVTPVAVLEYVENTQAYAAPELPPTLTLLGSLFPGPQPYAVIGGRRGGNLISHPARQVTPGVTAVIAVGAGDQGAQLRLPATTATALLTAGYPRKTKTVQYNDVSNPATLQRHANADLAAASGMTTAYTLSTFGSDPDWSSIARGDTVRVELDTDCFSTERPLVFTSRVLGIAVRVPDTGNLEVNYHLADTRDY